MIGNQRVGMAMTDLVRFFQSFNLFHVLLVLHRIQNIQPVFDRLAVGFLNRRKIGLRSFEGRFGFGVHEQWGFDCLLGKLLFVIHKRGILDKGRIYSNFETVRIQGHYIRNVIFIHLGDGREPNRRRVG